MAKFFVPKTPDKCGGKNCYESQTEAEIVAREQEILNMQNDLELKVYRCIICGQLHLTRTKPRNDI